MGCRWESDQTPSSIFPSFPLPSQGIYRRGAVHSKPLQSPGAQCPLIQEPPSRKTEDNPARNESRIQKLPSYASLSPACRCRTCSDGGSPRLLRQGTTGRPPQLSFPLLSLLFCHCRSCLSPQRNFSSMRQIYG